MILELSDLKLITASNIINLRTKAEMTQAQLGAELNYSDKTISKWERGEAIPDAYVLTEMAEIFGVTVDYLLTSHDAWEAVPDEGAVPERSFSSWVLISLVMVAMWTTAITVFVVLWLCGILWWRTFVIMLPLSTLVLVILMAVFKKNKYLQFAIAAFVLSIFVMLYFFVPVKRPWQLFLIAVPAVAIVFLACNIRKKPFRKKKKSSKKA